MKDIAKSSVLLGSTELSIVLVSILKAKFLAISIGPEGYGQFGLLNSFFTILTALCGGWIARGTLKYTAEFRQNGNSDGVYKVHNYSISLALILSSAAALIVIIFQDFIRNNILSPDIILLNYIIFCASFMASNISPFFAWFLQGHLLVKRTIFVRITTVFFNLFSVIVLVYFFELTGYYLSILFSSFFGLWILWRESNRITISRFLRFDIKDEILQKLLKFGGVNFILLVIHNVTEYAQRVIIITTLNMASLGLFQVANSIMNYMGIFNRGSQFINDPKMSQDIPKDERNTMINSFLRFNILIGIPISIIIVLFAKEFILILYNDNFVLLAPTLSAFVMSQFISFLAGGFQSVMIGKSFLRFHSFVSLLYSVIIILIPFIYLKDFGLISIGLSMIFGNVTTVILDYLYLKRKLQIEIEKTSFFLLALFLLFFTIAVELQYLLFLWKIIFLLIVFFLLFLFLSEHEKSTLRKLVISSFQLRKNK
jgi:PST family polysaccharide transporter